MSGPTVYMNEDGDFWVRRDQAPDPEAVTPLVVEFIKDCGYGDQVVRFRGPQTVRLSDCDDECFGTKHGRRRRAWLFTATDT